ncbi:hypothetical protein MTQ93_09655 [Staphylococcus agnetis]|uniref:hypothetical protein n=1 Tax=Staphylococcus agnetis TaxID=985762 RepID=UPI00208E6B29|nr:hypothetical protein [Staphylococcus agnetis]MCO4346309.1 hypothetical protein [Staphylococcus agnetis]MCO4360615.1 hypothetical protein [Staphylococcus agnetis]
MELFKITKDSFKKHIESPKFFPEQARKKGYDDDYYPFSNIGIVMFKILLISFKIYISMIVLLILFNKLYSEFNLKFIGATLPFLDSLQKNIFVFFLTVMCVYLLIVFLRARNFERNIILNDFRTLRIRKTFIKKTHYKKEMKELMEHQKKKNSKNNKRAIKKRIDALKKINKIKFFVNTRNKITDISKVEKQARARVRIPSTTESASVLLEELNHLPDVINHITRGKYTFGAFIISKDKKNAISRSVNAMPDKWYDPNDIPKDPNLPEVSELTFSYNLYPDRKKENEEKNKKAQKWVEKTAVTVEKILLNSGMKCNYSSSKINPRLVMMKFRIAEDNKYVDVARAKPLLAQALNIQNGLEVISDGSYIKVTMALKKEYITTADIATVVKEVFNEQGKRG